jgi:WD40 repeat protein
MSKAIALCASGSCVIALAVANACAAQSVSFVKEIAPILRDKCLTCHGPDKAKGEYRLDTFELLQKPGGSKNAPIVGGAPERSHLFELLTTADEDDRMPQKDDALPKEQIRLIERWINEGARFDAPDPKLSLASLAGYIDQPSPPDVYRASMPVTALAFHPGGKELAVSGYHEVMIWSVDDGVLLRRVTNVAERTLGLAYNPDGTLLATASGTPGNLGETKLFDSKTGKLVRTLAVTPDLMLAVTFDSQGRRVACGAADNTIRILDVESGKLQLTIEQHADWVTSVAFSADGSNIVSTSRDKTARIFDARTGELEATYTGHTEAIFGAAFSSDGKLVFSGGRDKELHVWEARDAKKTSELSIDGEISRLLLSTNGVFLAADKVVHQYSAQQKPERAQTFTGHNDVIYSIAVHEGSARLATGSYDGEVRIWEVEDGQLRRKFKAAPLQLSSK